MEKTSNPNKKLTKIQWQMKILKFLVVTLIITIVFWLLLEKFLKDDRSIYQKIGSLQPYSATIKEALIVKGYSIMPYADKIKAGNTQAAYDMLTEEYKSVVSYENYLKTLEGIDFSTFDMKEIKIKAEGTYVAKVVYMQNGEQKETEYLLYSNEKTPELITMSPNKFIYSYQNLKFDMNGVELSLKYCNIYTDHIELNASIKNKSFFDTMTFSSIGIGYGETINKNETVEFTLAPGEEKEVEINYETNYFLPNNIKIKRNIENETLRTYTFYFEDSK